MNKFTVALAIGLLMIGTFVNAQFFHVTGDADGYLVRMETSDVSFIQNGINDSIPVVNGTTGIFDKGYPDLPKFVHAFSCQDSSEYEIQVLKHTWVDVSASISPSLGFVYQNQKPGNKVQGNIYSSNAFYPEDLFRSFPVYTAGEESKQVVWFFPLQYNPVKKTLRIHTLLEIRFTPKPKQNSILKSAIAEPAFAPQKMLVIAPDNFKNALLPFVKWKNQKGIEVLIASSDSLKTSEAIKNEVYKQYANNSIQFVLLVGDHHQTPTSSSIYGPSDYAYGLLSGKDYYIDLCIGRFPSRTVSELQNMIDKTTEYEQLTTQREWFKSFGGLASKESGDNGGDNGESDLEHIVKIGKVFEAQSFVPEIIFEGSTENMPVSSLINKGCGYLFYIGHGNQTKWQSTPFNTDSVAKLSNYGMYPFIVDGACLNGDITYPVCLAEKFMGASKNNKATGSVAMLASTISQLWAPPMLGQDVIAQNLFSSVEGEKNTTLGKVANHSYNKIIDTYYSGGIETAYTWMLYGDPSLKLWTKTPAELELSLPEVFDVANDTLTVYGTDSAIVTIMSNNVLLDVAMIRSGKASLTKGDVLISDSVIVTVSKQNYLTKITKLAPYTDGSSYYNINSILVNDDNNGLPEYDEWIDLTPIVTNYGLVTGREVNVEVFLYDSLIEVNPVNISVDSIIGNTTDTLQGLKIRAIYPLPDGYTAKIRLMVSDKSGQVNSRDFTITFFAPLITVNDILVDGHRVSDGKVAVNNDTVSVSLIVTNSGHIQSSTIKTALQLDDMLMHYNSDTSYAFSIEPQTTDTINYSLRVDPNCIPGWLFKGHIGMNDTSSHPLLFSFYYKAIPQIAFDDGGLVEDEFPFYNYYKANYTQIIYRADELGNAPMLIDSIGFNIASVPFDKQKRIFSNFKISVGEVNSSFLSNRFISSDSLTPVYFQSSYSMTDQTGWFDIDIADYLYSGTNNLLIQIDWGLNSSNTGFNNSYAVVSHISNEESTGFGYNDFKTPSPWTNSSNVRPDIRFSGKLEQLMNVHFVYKNKGATAENETIYVKIGEQWSTLQINDTTSISLPEGEYAYIASTEKNGKIIMGGVIDVKANNQIIPIQMLVTELGPVNSCGSYVWNGMTYAESGTYTQTLESINGHDSIVILNLNINEVNTNMQVQENTIFILAENANAKILDCTNQEVIANLIGQTYTALVNGSYAVIVEQNGCIDTTECVNVMATAIDDVDMDKTLKIYPNTARDEVIVEFIQNTENASIILRNLSGQIVYKLDRVVGVKTTINISHLPNAYYFIELRNKGSVERTQLLKQ